MDRRAHSPIPAPREPRRDRMMPEPYGRHEDMRRPMRRQRSISPEMYGRRRQPSPGPGRYKRHRPADYDDRRSPPRRPSPDYARQMYEPHPGQGKDPPPPPKGPKSFKLWLSEQDDNMSPEEAQVAYDAYLAKHFGSELRAAFERNKDKLATREAFDPKTFAEALDARRAAAAEEAVHLTAAIAEGTYDPASDTFHQGTLQEELAPAAAEPPKPKQLGGQGGEVGGPPPPPPVSPLLWKPERVVADLKLARKLMVVLDAERGLEDNPLLPPDAVGATAAAGGEEGAAEAGQGEATAAEDGEAEAAAGDKATGEADAAADGNGSTAAVAGGDKRLAAVLAAIDAAEVVVEGEAALDDALGALDMALTWLWRVHGVDFYAGRELVKASEYNARLTKQRTLRGPKPEEGEEMDEADAKRDMERLATAVDERWRKRLTDGDPLKKGAQLEEIERRMDAWVEEQIVRVSDNKWGNHLSNKFFLEKKFVVKHILNKHPEKVVEARKALLADLYWEAYKAHHEAQRALVVTKQRAARVESAQAARAESMDFEDGRPRGGRPGRPMHSKIRPPGGMEMPLMMDPGAAGGAMLVPAGMGPMGPIFIPTGPMMPQMAPMDMEMAGMLAGGMLPMMGGGRGGRGGRGRPMGRGGGRMMAAPGAKLDAGGVREYYDLDAPRNNRAVLDYGDI